ncbi:MAG TPA: hypothetical protein VFN37_09555 [Candidatus Baltobacteraceae bacterium]|nr:hypothetical protein [Candidatus Baltobacteraceae bacterium]
MSDDFRRRRRLPNTGDSPRRSGGNNGMNPWVVTIFAALVVIAGGWFLGQALARVFNGPPKGETVAQAPTALPVVTPPASPPAAPTIAPQSTATPRPTPKPTPKPTPVPSVAPEPSPTATVKVVIAPTQTAAPPTAPTTAPTATKQPAPERTASASPAPATPAPAPQAQSPATRVVRAYIDALRRGDPSAASAYLGNGAPDEAFIDSATRISSISSTRNADGSYKVEVDMHTAQGEYYETFTVASDRILEKTAIKP